MASLKILALVLIASIYIGYEFKSIYVSEGHESPLVYKSTVFIIKQALKLSKLAAKLNLGTEAGNFRAVFENLHKLSKVKPDPNVIIKEKLVANVPVRIYRSVASQKKTSLPLIIYYHGGGHVFGSSLIFEHFFYRAIHALDVVVIAIEYRLAPEYPFPIGIDDCFASTKYILDHKSEFGVDVNRVVLAGDSAGGNIVAVTSQRLGEANQSPMPKIQVLIYPWTQMWTSQLPSTQKFNYDEFGFGMIRPWYIAGTNFDTTKVRQVLDSDENTALLKDPEQRKKIISYLDINKIPKKYRKGRDHYNGFTQTFPKTIEASSPLKTNKAMAETIAQLVSPRASPLFADNQTLALTPKKAYVLALEWDFLKDEGLLYSERLREAGIDVHVAFYFDAPHGTFQLPDKLSQHMHDDLIDYLKKNLK